MRREGFVALMDAMVFTVVVMIALSVMVGLGLQDGSDERDANAMLNSLLSAEVRMEDLSEEGDGSSVRLSDMCALHIVREQPGVEEYVTGIMDAFSGGRGYLLTLTFGEGSVVLGPGGSEMAASSEAEVYVTTGGTLKAELVLYRS